ncbi:serine hydrolase domain-containing protein [Hymenobacter ruricola]|uniref:Beta-lactamase family protein n=1 Tax=Hymenobacter ruricola TaxID=2791023 RepID=A0ABS0I318_9BACT|nr:serine hydrolase domain-containing protein [Hymenobacter ruricola]MBF9221351.1 beta-lactamase family protein [Hymenobacter ruricola]
MKLFFCISLFLIALSAPAQQAAIGAHDVLKDSIVAKLNRGDWQGIYAMGNATFRAEVSEAQLTGLLAATKDFGRITVSELISFDSTGALYRLRLAKRSLQLSVSATGPRVYRSLGLSFYKLPIVRTRTRFLSDNPLKTHLDSVVQRAVTEYMSNANVAGLSVGVLVGGQLHVYDFGETEKGSGVLPTPSTIYEIGSVTKTFTGTLLAQAVLDGKVRLQDDVRQYVAGQYPDLQYAGAPVRVVHLSNHTSGLPSEPPLPGTGQDPFAPGLLVDDALVRQLLLSVRPDTLPGVRRAYSNFAVGLEGLILEKAYRAPYEQLLKQYIFRPYGMRHSAIAVAKRDLSRYAAGYDVEGNRTAYWRNRLAEPAGGIRSTPHDMLLYVRGQLDRHRAAAQLSHQLTFGTAQAGAGLNWGISTTKTGHHLRWSHDGGTDGFTSLLLIYPELEAGIVLLTNTGDHSIDSFYSIARTIYSSWLK